MKLRLLIGGAALALSSTLALAQPEDLLPDVFRDPPPSPAPSPAQRTPAPQPARTAAPAPAPTRTPTQRSAPAVQEAPDVSAPSRATPSPSAPSSSAARSGLPSDFPSLAEIEQMEEGEINELLGLRQPFDVPPAARRALSRIGVIARAEGGFPSQSLTAQPAELVRAAIENTRGPMVSRWGHILLRRALASRLDAPEGMDPVEFAAMRAALLNRMGEGTVARALVQDVDSSDYNQALADAAFDAYLATGDILGMCPVARLQPTLRDDGHWILTQAICSAYLGETRSAERRLDRALGTGEAPEIDVRLAQRYAGAAAEGDRAVNIEWSGVEEMTPWRYALARALGVELPSELEPVPLSRFAVSDALIPAVPLLDRVEAADYAASRGVLSSAAMVDLYSQVYANDAIAAGDKQGSQTLREAYVARDAAARLIAMRDLWGDGDDFGRQVLTAYAAARLPVSEALQDDAADIIGSMLTAGLDRNAVRWGNLVDEGSLGWALLALAQPGESVSFGRGGLDSFVDATGSGDLRKARFLLAGLAGLGRINNDAIADFSQRLGVDFARQSPWSERISLAGQHGNATLVALLAGLGMQGERWEQMTARQLYHIVHALRASGLEAEARMIAAEAVARA